jgi:curved DNA-binding protein CbpA
MADKTLYDILEVSETASYEVIRAAYERLSRAFDPVGSTPEATVRYTAIKEAFLTLGNPGKRAAYDRRLQSQVETLVKTGMGMGPKLLIAGFLALGTIGAYSHQKFRQEEARLDQERAIAAEKAKEAESLAQAEAERVRQKQLHVRATIVQDHAMRQRDQDIARFQQELRSREAENRQNMERERYAKERQEAQRRNEEQQALRLAQQQAARERAALCQLERSRYGRSISC